MANRKKRGRSKGGELAAPTKQVTTSVDAGGVPLTDAEPPTKIGGRSKGKVGSENEPVETAPGDEELNISEDGVTVATATTIFQEVTNSTEVGGVPTTDPPMIEVPNNDEGGVKTRTDATEPSNTTALKQLRTTPDNELSTWTEEKLLSVCDYAYPFTIYQRCVPGNDWVTDAPISTPCDIFPVTGSRRKNEVRDNFDWLLPRTKSADVKEAETAYSSYYQFGTGFSSSDKMVSNKICAMPKSVEDRCVGFFEIHQCVLNHPLCNIEQKADWLSKPVGNLINRMNSAAKRPPTRGSVQESRMGHDIFVCSAYVPADDFVSVTDDVELVDFVVKDSSKKIWHCSDLIRSIMLRKAVLAAFTEAVDDDNFPELYSSLLSADPTKSNASGIAKQIQLLGLVSLFNSKCGTKVNAFRMHCFLLYSFTPETNSTQVHLLLGEHCLAFSSVNERILQILQLVQSDQVKTAALTLNPERDFQEHLPQAYGSLGFTSSSSPTNDKFPSYSRTSMIKMPKFTNRTIWSRYGKFVALSDEADNDPLLQMFCRTVSHLLVHPMTHNTSIGMRFSKEYITHHVSLLATGMTSDVNQCAKYVRAIATSLTRVPLAVITHALVNRMRETKKRNDKVMHETTLELVQYVSISLETATPNHKVFVGDCHSCILYCEKCNRNFGDRGNIFQVLAEAPHAILYHHGLELTQSNSADADDEDGSEMKTDERRFINSLPMHTYPPFLGPFSLNIIDKLDKMAYQRCLFGTGEHVSKNNRVKSMKYFHSLNEAMRIDTYYAGNEEVLKSRGNMTSALLLALFDSAHHWPGGNMAASETGNDMMTSFDEYGSKVATAAKDGEEWIQLHCPNDLLNQYRVLLGWCLLLTKQFLFNYTYLCKRLHDYISQDEVSPFTVEELLQKIGMDSSSPLFQSCDEHDMVIQSVSDGEYMLCDRNITVPLRSAHLERPVQEFVIAESLDEKGTISKVGKGWDKSSLAEWFDKPKGGTESKTSGVLHGRTISSMAEAVETVWILRTLHSVRLLYDNENGRGYSMTCNVRDVVMRNPHLLDGPMKSFFQNPTFECSNSFIASLPFDFVKRLRIGKDTQLPADWRAAVKKDVQAEISQFVALFGVVEVG